MGMGLGTFDIPRSPAPANLPRRLTNEERKELVLALLKDYDPGMYAYVKQNNIQVDLDYDGSWYGGYTDFGVENGNLVFRVDKDYSVLEQAAHLALMLFYNKNFQAFAAKHDRRTTISSPDWRLQLSDVRDAMARYFNAPNGSVKQLRAQRDAIAAMFGVHERRSLLDQAMDLGYDLFGPEGDDSGLFWALLDLRNPRSLARRRGARKTTGVGSASTGESSASKNVEPPPANVRNQKLLDPNNNKPSLQAELFERERNAVQFGQKRVGENFRQYSEAPDVIRGRSIADVAADLKAGKISPDSLPIYYFEHEGQLIAINNRGLAALSEAGLKPTVLRRVPIDEVPPSVLERLTEPPIVRGQTIPGPMIPVTKDKAGKVIDRIITLP